MRIRIRHDGLLRVDSIMRLAAGVGLEPGGGVRSRLRASRPTPPTTSGSQRRTPAARAKALMKPSKRPRPAPPKASARASRHRIEGSFKEPDAVASDSGGDIFVGDSGHNRVLEFNSKREYLRQWGSEGSGEGQFQGIAGIATNASGDVYVSSSDRIQEFSPTGAYLRQFGTPGSGNGQFARPERDRDRLKRQRVGARHLQLPHPGVLTERRIPLEVRIPGHRQRPARVGLRPGLLRRQPVCL